MSRGGPLTQCRDAGDETGKSVLCVWPGQSHRPQTEVCAGGGVTAEPSGTKAGLHTARAIVARADGVVVADGSGYVSVKEPS